MKWIIEKDLTETPALIKVLDQMGVFHVDTKHYAFMNEADLRALSNGQTDDIFVYGSIGFCQKASRINWSPGPYFNIRKYDCTYYYPRFGEHLVNSKYIMLPFGELNRYKAFLLEHFGIDEAIFVRPNTCSKIFTGQVLTERDWDSELRLLGWYDVAPEELVVVAVPKKIDAEYRVIMRGVEPITASQYSSWDERYKKGQDKERSLCENDDLFVYVKNLMESISYTPDPVWVLDIAKVNNQFKVLEVGSVSCCGFYACDLHKVVAAIESSLIKENT